MKIKVNYEKKTGAVLGYYPDDITYKKIPEPYIEITKTAYQANFEKDMLIKDGVYQQNIKSDEVLLEEQKQLKISQLNFKKVKEVTVNIRGADYQLINDGEIRSLLLSKIFILQDKINSGFYSPRKGYTVITPSIPFEINDETIIELTLEELKQILIFIDDKKQSELIKYQNNQRNIKNLKNQKEIEDYKID